LDTSAFFSGFDSFSVNIEQFSTSEVEEELRANSMTLFKFKTAVESKRLTIKSPSENALAKVQSSSVGLGDSFLLSETDKHVLALALELKDSGYDPQIISDDYSMQNVATQLGIKVTSLATQGIRRLLTWIRYCPACHKGYPANHRSDVCDICGTALKRKPARKNTPVTKA
jgi:endoribonuclease Nob1